jgi:FtsZ-binding cell division protein ZapB
VDKDHYVLVDEIRRLEIELSQAINKAKDAIEILKLSVNHLKEARLELEQEDQ